MWWKDSVRMKMETTLQEIKKSRNNQEACWNEKILSTIEKKIQESGIPPNTTEFVVKI